MMELQSFLAESAPDAVMQIRERLGPEAVVVNVRKLSPGGLARLWQKPKIEVIAFRPETPVSGPNIPEALTELKQELSSLKQKMEMSEPSRTVSPPFGPPVPVSTKACPPADGQASSRLWRIGPVLESTGLLPVHAQRLVETLSARCGGVPPESLAMEIQLVSKVLQEFWRPRTEADAPAHLFIGAPGSGKTTCLCQWLARTVLMESRMARVWRLDGQTANHAESLSVYSEILGVALERFGSPTSPLGTELCFIDLPGVNWTDSKAVEALMRQASEFPEVQVHLVLNAAYEVNLLFAQIRAFAGLPITDLIFTHLDEEPRWGKLWNFVLGTKYTIGCLGAGQNVPGDFQFASPEIILGRQFLRK